MRYSKEMQRKQKTSKEDWPAEAGVEPRGKQGVPSISTASKNGRNDEEEYAGNLLELMSLVARKVKDKLVLKLIRLYLISGVMLNGTVIDTEEGVPQGGPLSPLLSNIMLNELDKELEKRGHYFCRYADDGAPRRRRAG